VLGSQSGGNKNMASDEFVRIEYARIVKGCQECLFEFVEVLLPSNSSKFEYKFRLSLIGFV